TVRAKIDATGAMMIAGAPWISGLEPWFRIRRFPVLGPTRTVDHHFRAMGKNCFVALIGNNPQTFLGIEREGGHGWFAQTEIQITRTPENLLQSPGRDIDAPNIAIDADCVERLSTPIAGNAPGVARQARHFAP